MPRPFDPKKLQDGFVIPLKNGLYFYRQKCWKNRELTYESWQKMWVRIKIRNDYAFFKAIWQKKQGQDWG